MTLSAVCAAAELELELELELVSDEVGSVLLLLDDSLDSPQPVSTNPDARSMVNANLFNFIIISFLFVFYKIILLNEPIV
jgi:hypothetical protein